MYVCVLILLYVSLYYFCYIHVSLSYCYMCPRTIMHAGTSHTTMCVLVLCTQAPLSYCYMCPGTVCTQARVELEKECGALRRTSQAAEAKCHQMTAVIQELQEQLAAQDSFCQDLRKEILVSETNVCSKSASGDEGAAGEARMLVC